MIQKTTTPSLSAPTIESELAKLAQIEITGQFEETERVLELADRVSPESLAEQAVVARQKGARSVPALLLARLSLSQHRLFETIFDEVVLDFQTLQYFVEFMRKGFVGRRSLGSLPKRRVQQWLTLRSDKDLIREALSQASLERRPTLGDIVRMVRPRPLTRQREALYAYLVGKQVTNPLVDEALVDGALLDETLIQSLRS